MKWSDNSFSLVCYAELSKLEECIFVVIFPKSSLTIHTRDYKTPHKDAVI